jgi:hypothetical protein
MMIWGLLPRAWATAPYYSYTGLKHLLGILCHLSVRKMFAKNSCHSSDPRELPTSFPTEATSCLDTSKHMAFLVEDSVSCARVPPGPKYQAVRISVRGSQHVFCRRANFCQVQTKVHWVDWRENHGTSIYMKLRVNWETYLYKSA